MAHVWIPMNKNFVAMRGAFISTLNNSIRANSKPALSGGSINAQVAVPAGRINFGLSKPKNIKLKFF